MSEIVVANISKPSGNWRATETAETSRSIQTK
jgi:hypothetical protein